jgi:O-antigen/teichoic acid export membrane protein
VTVDEPSADGAVVGRGKQRDSALARAGAAGAVVRLLGVALSVVTVSVTVAALGDVKYGVAATLATSTALLGFADLGIGQGLLTRLAAAHGRDDATEMRALVSAAWSTLVAIGAVVALVGIALTVLLPWQTLLGAEELDPGSIRLSVLIFFLATAAAVPCTIGQRVLIGLQLGARASVWAFATSASILAAALVGAALDASLVAFVFITVAVPVVVSFVQSVVVLGRTHVHLRPSPRLVTRAKVRELVQVGGLFLTLSIAVAVSYQTDALVVSAVLGAASAAVFAVALRMFTTLTGLFAGVTQQMWPALAEALSAGDVAWVRSRFLRVLGLTTGGAAAISAFLVVFGQPIVRVWVGDSLVPPISLLVPFALWTTYSLAMTQCSYLLNAAHVVGPQVVMAIAMATVNIPLSILLTREIGLAGPLYGSLIAHLVFVGVPTLFLVRRTLRAADRRAAA